MCNELSVTASEHIYFGDSDQRDADPSLPHRKVRLGIFPIKRDTTRTRTPIEKPRKSPV